MTIESPTATARLNATLISRYKFNHRFSILRVRPVKGRVPSFRPGQHITVGIPAGPAAQATWDAQAGGNRELTKRKYSIASAADEYRHLEFFVVRPSEERETPHLARLRVGESLWLDSCAEGKLGIENLARDRDLVLVSTGTAVAPAISILRTYRGTDRWRRLVIINGVRMADDLGYRYELEAAARTDRSVYYLPIVSREPEGSDWHGMRGHVQNMLKEERYYELVGAALNPEHCEVIVCGNPGMVSSVRSLLEQSGFRVPTGQMPGNVHLERYW